VSILPHEVVSILPHEAKQNTGFYVGGSGLGRTYDFQKFCGSGLHRIQLLRIRIGLGLKNFTVRSSLVHGLIFDFLDPGSGCFQQDQECETGSGLDFVFTE